MCLCAGSKLLLALDAAVTADPAAVASAVMNKEYMAQLVEVQHQRGAQGGHQFAAILDTDTEKRSPEGEWLGHRERSPEGEWRARPIHTDLAWLDLFTC